MGNSLLPDWTASTEGVDPLPAPEVAETNIPGLHEVTLTVAARPAEGRIAHGLHTHQ